MLIFSRRRENSQFFVTFLVRNVMKTKRFTRSISDHIYRSCLDNKRKLVNMQMVPSMNILIVLCLGKLYLLSLYCVRPVFSVTYTEMTMSNICTICRNLSRIRNLLDTTISFYDVKITRVYFR